MFYTLPYCPPPQQIEAGLEGLGEALQGYELRKSPVRINFKSKFIPHFSLSIFIANCSHESFFVIYVHFV